ncbi:unnamed protein product [Dovyalis caffra]|uniref:Ribosomal protein L32 n=1 Tax=Dovyalis caffra TaxID=77055 RepID=A0AAV1QWY7_9ROSI|nr:unnamed protein product [Dovyalis caffra]
MILEKWQCNVTTSIESWSPFEGGKAFHFNRSPTSLFATSSLKFKRKPISFLVTGLRAPKAYQRATKGYFNLGNSRKLERVAFGSVRR